MNKTYICRGGPVWPPGIFRPAGRPPLPASAKEAKRRSRGEGFRFPSPLKNPLTLKRPKGRGRDPSPLETPPGGLCDYQIAPLPLRGKGRWRPLAAICKSSLAINSRVAQPCISEQKRQRKEKQRQCNI